MNSSWTEMVNALRFLVVDMIESAGSGHPGMPLGMAEAGSVLWHDFLRFNPKNASWANRDRFVLSNGHGAALQYALLHLSGFPISLDDLRQFRRLNSITPGHPEYNLTPGVEATTGPLGQGLGYAGGMAIAESILAARFNRPGFPLVDHFTYVFAGDGCLMEGVSHEVSSLLGTLKIGKLILFWDQNQISIDGPVKNWFAERTADRYRAYDWHVQEDIDGNDRSAIVAAIKKAQENKTQPSLICLRTTIGFGAPRLAGSAKIHGTPLGREEVARMRENFSWDHKPFVIPQEALKAWDKTNEGLNLENAWEMLWNGYQKSYPLEAEEYQRTILDSCLPTNFPMELEEWLQLLPDSVVNKPIATRKASQMVLEKIHDQLPELLGGAADLTPSVLTDWPNRRDFSPDQPDGDYISYGVREFGMSVLMIGIALHGGLRPFGGTFLAFQTYSMAAIRSAAQMGIKVIFLFSHDSIGVGEDGGTHQPIEQIASLRELPGLDLWRPCDLVETTFAWQLILERDGPSALILSRQSIIPQVFDIERKEGVLRGGYLVYTNSVLNEEALFFSGVLLVATGSEVQLAVEIANALSESVTVSVISIPCVELFLRQPEEYQRELLPLESFCFILEAGSAGIWPRIMEGRNGKIFSIECFGRTGSTQELFEIYGFVTEQIARDIVARIGDKLRDR